MEYRFPQSKKPVKISEELVCILDDVETISSLLQPVEDLEYVPSIYCCQGGLIHITP
jgi:hypothetical protein